MLGARCDRGEPFVFAVPYLKSLYTAPKKTFFFALSKLYMQLDEETYDLGMEKNNNFNMAKKERASDDKS